MPVSFWPMIQVALLRCGMQLPVIVLAPETLKEKNFKYTQIHLENIL